MRKIETREQREKALEWLVKTADEVSHPLIDEQDKAKKLAVYDYVSQQVQEFNEKLYADSEYPTEQKKEQQQEINLSDWI